MTNWTPVTPLSDEPQDQAYWEPQQFKIGDRVRVRLSGECALRARGRDYTDKQIRTTGHPEWMDRMVGEVRPCPMDQQFPCGQFPGHPYPVKLLSPDGRPWGSHFAACELELVE